MLSPSSYWVVTAVTALTASRMLPLRLLRMQPLPSLQGCYRCHSFHAVAAVSSVFQKITAVIASSMLKNVTAVTVCAFNPYSSHPFKTAWEEPGLQKQTGRLAFILVGASCRRNGVACHSSFMFPFLVSNHRYRSVFDFGLGSAWLQAIKKCGTVKKNERANARGVHYGPRHRGGHWRGATNQS